MEKRDSSRARRSILTLFVVLILAIFVVLVTVVIATLYRVTLLQSERVQSLETVIVKLTTRIHKLEASFAARKIDDKFLGETNAETEEKTEKEKRPGNKVCLNLTKYFVARCPNLCISNCVGEHKLFKRSYPRRCFPLQQMSSHLPQTRGRRQFYGYEVKNDGRCRRYSHNYA